MARGPQYYGSIPGIAQAYQNDPKNRLAQSALALGSSTAPVAQGGWAATDGLARAAQAIVGAVMQKGQDKKYAQREQDYTAQMAQAAKLASTPQPQNPAAANPATGGLAAAAGALAGPQQPASMAVPTSPMQTVDPTAALAGQGGGPQGQMAPQAPPMAPPPQNAPQTGPGGPLAGMASVTAGIPRMGGGGTDYYRTGIRPIEGGTDPKTGAFRTSPKGAVGPGQVMPNTAPEAARLAGVPFNDTLYRTDAAYNDKLGEAYYAKQLETFGDPVVAAAAYNAGPGRVKRALRQANRTGQPLTAHLPDETKTYVENFAQRIGLTGEGSPQAGGTPITLGIQSPTMEAVPEMPAAPTEAPAAPERPQEVQSNRVAMAQQLMQSGNPDLMAIAQQYLDKGLDEQNSARTLASQQEFAQGQTGYNAGLQDYNAARGTARDAAVTTSRDASQRNFRREEQFRDQTFGAGQAQVGREYQTATREDNQSFEAGQTAAQMTFQARMAENQRKWASDEAQANRDNRLSVAATRAGGAADKTAKRNAYFNTPTGLKMQEKAGTEMNSNNDAISKYRRFLDLNDDKSTGGMAINVPLIGQVYGYTDSKLREMTSLANDATLAGLGGSLGTAISDGDRRFIADSNISVGAPRQANRNIALAKIGALERKNDYLVEFANAQADGGNPQTFAKEWRMFANNTPIAIRGKDGNYVVNDKPMTFAEWKASRPTFDAQGKRVK
jgi:hypothetical protein